MPIIGIVASSITNSTLADAGAMVPLQVVTVVTSGTTSVTFTNIPQTYAHLQIRCVTVGPAVYDYINLNGDATSSYAWHQFTGDGASVTAANGSNTSLVYANQIGTSTTIPYVSTIDIFDYANTNKYKTLKIIGGQDTNGGGGIWFRTGHWRSNNGITQVSFISSTGGYNQYAKFALYGIKAAS